MAQRPLQTYFYKMFALVALTVWLAFKIDLNSWIGRTSNESAPTLEMNIAKAPTSTHFEGQLPVLMKGRVLPFHTLTAVRNFAIAGGPESMVSVAVHGGSRPDWAATAIYLARASIVNGATFANVTVYTDNPWGDRPPEGAKTLARAYYDPRPGEIQPEHTLDVFLAERAGTDAEIDYDELATELADRYASKIDPNKGVDKANAEARKLVILRYHLPDDWKPPTPSEVGIGGEPIDGLRVQISDASDGGASLAPMLGCLQSNEGFTLLKGCLYKADRYPQALTLQVPDVQVGQVSNGLAPDEAYKFCFLQPLLQQTDQEWQPFIEEQAAKSNDPTMSGVPLAQIVEEIKRKEGNACAARLIVHPDVFKALLEFKHKSVDRWRSGWIAFNTHCRANLTGACINEYVDADLALKNVPKNLNLTFRACSLGGLIDPVEERKCMNIVGDQHSRPTDVVLSCSLTNSSGEPDAPADGTLVGWQIRQCLEAAN